MTSEHFLDLLHLCSSTFFFLPLFLVNITFIFCFNYFLNHKKIIIKDDKNVLTLKPERPAMMAMPDSQRGP